MHHSTQKHKLTEYLDGIYCILREYKNDSGVPFIKSSKYEFKKKWSTNTYNTGINKIGIDLLYSIIMQNKLRIYGIQKRIMIDFCGNLEAYLQTDIGLSGKYKKAQSGIAGLSCLLLEKLCKNKIDFFDDLFKIMQEKK